MAAGKKKNIMKMNTITQGCQSEDIHKDSFRQEMIKLY